MEKNQYELCVEVLRRLNSHNLLDDMILIGSWCISFYKHYFSDIQYASDFKTRDMDFLIPYPQRIKENADIPGLLKDLGFVIGYKGQAGYIKLEHSDLIIEFLAIEKGRGTDKPIKIPQWGVNAVALRFLSFLSADTIKVKVEDFYLTLPHPANFALHKLIIFQRRRNMDKAAKDRNAAVEIIKALIAKGEVAKIRQVFDSISNQWQKKIAKGLEAAKEKDILAALGL